MALNIKNMSIFDISNKEELDLFIKNGGDINEKNWRGETALYMEDFINNYEILQGLLEVNIDTNHESILRAISPPVFQVTQYDCLELLIQYKVDINVKDEEGCPLGHYFASSPNLLELLLVNHYDINLTTDDGETILFRDDLEADSGFIAIDAGINIFQKNDNGETALFHINDAMVAKDLIKRGLSVHDLNNENSTPLLINDQSTCCAAFIEAGADIHHVNDEGDNALTVRRYFGINKIKLMVESGIDINHCNTEGQNIAFLTQDKNAIEFLISRGIDIEHRNKLGNNLLEETISIEMAEVFIKAGISISDNMNNYAEHLREYIKEELSKRQKEILTQTMAVPAEIKKTIPRI